MKSFYVLITAMASLFYLCCPLNGFATETLMVAVMDDLQPWVLVEGDSYEGVYPDLMRELAKQSGMEIQLCACPVKRCLLWMKTGEVDMIIGLKDTPQRKTYMEFLTTPYRYSSPKVFYLKKGDGQRLTRYEDLHQLIIGTQLGTKYFPQFDEDKHIRKEEVATEDQSFHKLISGRIDAVLIPEDRGEYLIRHLDYGDSVEKSVFTYPDGSPRYIAISKKSKHIKKIDTFNKAMEEIVENGILDSLYEEEFFDKFHVPEENYRWK